MGRQKKLPKLCSLFSGFLKSGVRNVELNCSCQFLHGLKEVTIWDFNNTHQLVQIARRVLEGEILVKIQQDGQSIDVPIKAGEMFLLPAR